jgi:cyclic pyranopterin phosphate synthase
MVDVSLKKPTQRTALTSCIVKLNGEAYTKLKEKSLSKGDAISIAELAGIMGAKKTSDLVKF